MVATEIDVPTADGVMEVSLHHPKGAGPWPVVVMYTDIGGLRPTFEDMAEHLAGLGFVVAVPDLYHRSAPWAPFDPATIFSDADEFGRAISLAGSVGPDEWVADTEACMDALATRPEVVTGPFGTTGYCYGGRVSLTVAGRLGERVAGAASFHGGRLAADDPHSPHLLAAGVRARIYVGAARDDGSFPPDQARLLASAYDDAGVDHEIEEYDALHGFAVPDNPTYEPAAATRHWAALDALFHATLHRT